MILPDIQNTEPKYSIPLKTVGIKNFKLPIFIDQKDNVYQHTVANIDVFVNLKELHKGINMSRLPIGLHLYKDKQLNSTVIEEIAEYIRQSSEAENCQIIYKFPYFLNKTSPISNIVGLVYYNIEFDLIKTIKNTTFFITVESMGTSLCPCSKELSEQNGAHNQRSIIKVKSKINPNHFIWIEDIINIIESCYSCQIYSVLKRSDEKEVTINAYKNPKFVEDIGRELVYKFNSVEQILSYEIEVSNEESIHQHNAYCKIIKE